jgi:two-component system cell cycle sensor histidine kinase/response regulator CckA
LGSPLRVLFVEDSPDHTVPVTRELRRAGYEVEFERLATDEAMRGALSHRNWDLIISEYRLAQLDAISALRILRESGRDIPLLVVAAAEDEASILEVMKAGANDFLTKDNLKRLIPVVERELHQVVSRREQRRLEDQLRQWQKMEAIGRLAGGLAHDFNNLLTVISGYSELLLHKVALQAAERAGVEEIQKAAERGGALTRQLLAFSRRQPLEPRIIDINELVVNMEKMLRRLIGEDIQLATVPGNEVGKVKTDPGQLEQVIMNIVVNGRDAMPQGGKLTIETCNFELDEEPARAHPGFRPGPYVLLAITDTGSGMDAETKSHLFEPFFTTKDPGKGTGLGLATAYGIVTQSGGSVSVYSEPHRGTTVKIYLPRVEEAIAEEQPELESAATLLGSETVLLVEDEARVRKLICEVLTMKGYQVLECTRAEEAVRLFDGHGPSIDLVIADVVMPEMSGPELVRRLAVQRPELRVLFISGYPDEAVIHHGILTSGAAFLQKPFLPDALARKVREILDAQQQMGAMA